MPDYIHLDEIALLTVMPWKPHRHHHRLTNRNLFPPSGAQVPPPGAAHIPFEAPASCCPVGQQTGVSKHAPHFHPAPEPADHTRSTQLPRPYNFRCPEVSISHPATQASDRRSLPSGRPLPFLGSGLWNNTQVPPTASKAALRPPARAR